MAKKLIAALTDSTLFLQEWFANPQRTGRSRPVRPNLGRPWPSGCRPIPKVLCWNSARHRRGDRGAHQARPARRPARRHRTQSEDGAAAARKISARPDHQRRRMASGPPVAQPARTDQQRRRGHLQPAAAEFSPGGGRGARAKNPRRAGAATATGCNTATTSAKIHRAAAASFQLRASKIVWLNFPPARVSVFQK